jgi:hypothetical protein
MKTILYLTLALLILGSCSEEEATIKKLPALNTSATTNLTATTATFNGTIIDVGSPAYTERGFVYATTTMPTLENTITQQTVEVTDAAEFSTNVLDLEFGNTYFVRAYAINSVGTAYSANEVSFTTVVAQPALTTDSVTNVSIGNASATFYGTILSVGDPAYTERGFAYGMDHDPTVENNAKTIAAGDDTGAFSADVTEGLQEGNIYYIRTYATSPAGTAYGEEITLDFNAIMPRISTLAVTGVTETTATFNGDVTITGDPAYTEKGFVYGTSHDPSTEDNYTIVPGTGTGTFNADITGLMAGVFYVRAYAKTGASIVYGEEVSFTINHPDVVMLPEAGLMVQKMDINTGDNMVTVEQAKTLCQNSTLAGFTGWRLPTEEEWVTYLFDKIETIGGFKVGKDEYPRYWDSTEMVISIYTYPKYVDLSDMKPYIGIGALLCRARCIRDL